MFLGVGHAEALDLVHVDAVVLVLLVVVLLGVVVGVWVVVGVVVQVLVGVLAGVPVGEGHFWHCASTVSFCCEQTRKGTCASAQR